MDVHVSSGEPTDDTVTTVENRQTGEEAAINDETSREDALLEKLEEMYIKLESGSLGRDVWEGEDVECPNARVKKSERLAKKKLSKSKLATNSTEQAGALGDFEEGLVVRKVKEKRYSFKQAGSQERIKEGKEKTVKEIEEIEKIRNLALQRRETTKRRRKRVTRSELKTKKQDGFEHAIIEKMDVVRNNLVGTLGHFPINKERENASWRSAVSLIAPKDIHSILIGSSTTFVRIANAWLESYPRFQRFAVVFVTHYKNPDSNFGTSSMAKCGIVQPYTSAKETIFPHLPSNAAKSAYQEMEGRAMLRPGNLKVPPVTENPWKDEITIRKQAMTAVHAQLLEKVIEMKLNMKARREKMAAFHNELKRLVFKKGLGMNEDEDEDACFVPRRLFLFDIQDFSKVPQLVGTPHVPPNIPSCSKSPLADHVEESETTVKKTKRSLGGRLLKFLGFR